MANLDDFKLEFLERTQRRRSEGGFYEEQIFSGYLEKYRRSE